jgi:hypothetical protein
VVEVLVEELRRRYSVSRRDLSGLRGAGDLTSLAGLAMSLKGTGMPGMMGDLEDGIWQGTQVRGVEGQSD